MIDAVPSRGVMIGRDADEHQREHHQDGQDELLRGSQPGGTPGRLVDDGQVAAGIDLMWCPAIVAMATV